MFKIIIFIIGLISSLLFSSCDKIDSYRIPYAPVNIELNNDGLWNTYGVHSMGIYNRFIKNDRIPANFSYTALTYTGFGGVLLIGGPNNDVLVYDLCCPVEVKSTTRVYVNDKLEAQCPVCGSRYDILYLNGSPLSGPALDYKYGLQRYHAIASNLGGYTIVR